MLPYHKAVPQTDSPHEIKNEYIPSPLAVTSTQYLLYLHYGIQESDSGSRVIYKAAQKSYLDFSRREFFQKSASSNDRKACKKAIVSLLREEIPELLKSKSHVEFDERHHSLCEKILRIYSPVCRQSYGIAQRWVNLTLQNLAAVDSMRSIKGLPIEAARRFFHAPVDRYIVEAASCKTKGDFQHGLNLKCAPLKHEPFSPYEIDFYHNGKTQPYHLWEYEEYKGFQSAVRGKLGTLSDSRHYQDVLDWAVRAFLEVAQKRFIY